MIREIWIVVRFLSTHIVNHVSCLISKTIAITIKCDHSHIQTFFIQVYHFPVSLWLKIISDDNIKYKWINKNAFSLNMLVNQETDSLIICDRPKYRTVKYDLASLSLIFMSLTVNLIVFNDISLNRFLQRFGFFFMDRFLNKSTNIKD